MDFTDLYEKINSLRSRKEIVPLRIVLFVDGWHFRLACETITKEKKNMWVKSKQSHGFGTPSHPSTLPIAPELSWTGLAILESIANKISQRMIDLVTSELGQKLVPAYPRWTLSDMESQVEIKRRLNQMEECDALVDEIQLLKIYAAEPPSPTDLRKKFQGALNSGRYEKGSRGYNLLKENIELAAKRKLKPWHNKRPRNFEEYERFLHDLVHFTSRKESDENHQIKFAITRIDVHTHPETHGVTISEKGVDANLILGLLDELKNSKTSAMCLISNDSDYYPIVERIKETSTRPFFLGSTIPARTISSALRQTVGDEWIISVTSIKDIKNQLPYFMSPEWAEALGQNTGDPFWDTPVKTGDPIIDKPKWR